jgi:hypothetical protein
MISRIRVSSIGGPAAGWDEAAARLRWAVDVGKKDSVSIF